MYHPTSVTSRGPALNFRPSIEIPFGIVIHARIAIARPFLYPHG